MRTPETAFKLFGATGLSLGGPLAIWLAFRQGLSPWIEVALISVAVGMLLTPLTVKVFTGVAGFVFYRDVICIFAAVWLTLRWFHQPILPYLDVTIAGAGAFHACGRIGCLLSGCCFGRPSKFGRCYGQAHASMGFPLELVGVRLFPIQAVESIWIGILVAFSTMQLLHHTAPGTVFASYVTGYALGRFVFEFARGDLERPYTLGFSQAQWISLILMSAMLWGEFRGRLPFHKWHAFALGALIFTMLLVAVARRLTNAPRHLLLTPGHMQEIAAALKQAFDHAEDTPRTTPVYSTSLGIQISGGVLTRRGDPVFHYALSSQDSHLPPAAARVLVRLILRLRHPLVRFYQCSRGALGVYHLLVPQDKA